ncbi:MAG: tetratricopeptide repeat protein [Gammaproteobacteria bacterium]|nr:tetratricopeptide repeat protein [Gammaproteobacteria bacterium]
MTQAKGSHYDARGVPVSSCEPQSLDDYETALLQFHSYFGDPTETLAATLDADPEFVLGHVFFASALMMMTEKQYLPVIRQHIEQAEALAGKANARERLLTLAARQWMEGRWDQASLTWDQVLVEQPLDAMALQLGHLTDFYRGDCFNLRDRLCRVMTSWDKGVTGYSYILGMQAFGFEECNQYDKAELVSRTALDMEARDPWAIHALAHVFEMQGRFDEGKDMYHEREDDWAPDNGFAFHNWWHLALYHIEHEDFDGALGLYDSRILPGGDSDVSLQMVDASALLWRLYLLGVDVGSRWDQIADLWANRTSSENGYYAFNDLHAVIAFVGAGRFEAARDVLAAVEDAAAHNPGVTRMMAQDVGIAACRAMIDFGQQRYREAIDSLLPIRTIAHRFGGSHAQRDILTQTLTESALRGGELKLANNLVSERKLHKTLSPLCQRFAARLSV